MRDLLGLEIAAGSFIAYNFEHLPVRVLRVVVAGPTFFQAVDARPAYPLYSRIITFNHPLGRTRRAVVVSESLVREGQVFRRPR